MEWAFWLLLFWISVCKLKPGFAHSPYTGMGNNPVMTFDPTGLWGYYNRETETYVWVNGAKEDELYDVQTGLTWELITARLNATLHKGQTLNTSKTQ